MSTVNPSDLLIVNRAGTTYKVTNDKLMATVQDTDWLLVNRGGIDYKVSVADWKASQSKAPDVGTVTLSDVAGGARFTSTAFPISATMVEDGLPKSDKKLKAYVEGALKSAAVTSGIASVAGSVITLTDNTQLANFKAGDAVTEVKADGTPGDATGTLAADADPTAKTITLSASTGTWDVGSQVKGPLKTQMETVTPQSDVITYVNTSGAQPVLTFATNKHLAKFAAGDVVKQNDAATGPVYSTAITTPAGNPDAPKAFDGLLTDWLGVNSGGITWRPTQFTSGSYSVRVRINSKREAQVNGGAWIKNNAADWDWVSLGTVSSISSIGIGNTDGIAPAGNCGLAAVEINGSILVDGQITPSGTVASTDPTANTMTLATSTGTWGPANTGKTVIGPTKTGPASNVKLYCKLNAAGAVSDLQSADPGFTAWTPAGTGPYTGNITFPATLPSGQPPDTDLPAGTTLTVEVQASNTAGTDSAKSNTITPA